MTITQVPLEKQLVNLDLAKGMDERTRPELNGGITLIENLVQDQTGAWTKRGGTTGIIPEDVSGSGARPLYPKKIVQLVGGWGVIANNGRLLVKQDTTSAFRVRQRAMDFSVASAAFVGSSGSGAQTTLEASLVFAAAGCSTHDAYIMHRQTMSGATTTFKLSVIERSSGVEYVYDYSLVTAAGNNIAKMVFIGDRYLQVFTSGGFGGTSNGIYCVTIDTAAVMPVNEAALTATTIITGNLNFHDVIAGATLSYVLHSNIGGIVARQVEVVNTVGAVVDTATYPAAETYTSLALNEATSTLWMVGNAGNQVQGVNSALVATVTTLMYNPGITIGVAAYITSDQTSNTLHVVVHNQNAFNGTAGTHYIDSLVVWTIATVGGAAVCAGGMYGWKLSSVPFWSSVTAKVYAHLTKSDVYTVGEPRTTLGEVGTNVIADLSTHKPFWRNTAALAIPYGSFRIACCLEPFSGLARVGVVSKYRYGCPDGYSLTAFVPFQTFRGTAGIGAYRLVLAHSGSYGSCNFGGSTHIAHGGLNSYDGRNFYECGIVDQPIAVRTTPAATPGNLSGSYRYYTVFRHTDANGAAAYSRVYGPITAVNVAASTGQNTFVIQPHGITNRDAGSDSVPIVEVFRTKNGGTQFYLVASTQHVGIAGSTTPLVTEITSNTTTGLLTFTDNTADTVLAVQAIMYRQPGTTNSPVDRYAPPAARFVVQHKDRLFCTDAFGQRVCYSSFFVDGEQPWFNPAFSFYVHAGTGPITALASMDGRLFVFKRDAIFVVDGDGPGEAGPTGNEFSPPQSLASVYGCVDHRSLVVTPKGIMYRSTRGIEMLSRSLQVDWVGERVYTTLDANPSTTGSCIDRNSRVRWTLAAAEPTSGFYYQTGVQVIYDTACDAWSVERHTGYTGIYGQAYANIGVVNDNGTSKVVFADGYIGIATEDLVTRQDSLGYYVPFKIESGWIKQGPQARQRVSDIMLLAKKRIGANHALKISFAYDYSDTYTQTYTWEPGALNAFALEELNMQPSKQTVLAIRVKVEDQAPALVPIVSSTGATPIVLTLAAGHGFVNGGTIVVANHTLNIGANGTWVVAAASATEITLTGSVGSGVGPGGADGTAQYPVGTGAGCDILAVTAEVAPKLGAPKLAAGQKS